MDKYDYGFIREILAAAVNYAHFGFSNTVVKYPNGMVTFTTIIINDIAMMEVEIFDAPGDILYWRVVEVERTIKEYDKWVKEWS